MIICNWYMAYMCCLFSVLYFFFELFCAGEKKKYVVSIVQYGVTMLLAGDGIYDSVFTEQQ